MLYIRFTCFLAALFFGIGAAWRAANPEPGHVSAYIAAALRLNPFTPYGTSFTSLFAPVSGAPSILAFFSAAALGLLAFAQSYVVRQATATRPSRIPAVAAALVFTCPAFLHIAWRPLPDLVAVLPTITAIFCGLAYANHSDMRLLHAAAAAWSLGMLCHPATTPWTAVAWIAPALMLFRRSLLTPHAVARLSATAAGTLLAGFVFLVLRTYADPSADWRGASSLAARASWIGLEWMMDVRHQSIPEAWLYLSLVCWLPAAVTLAISLRRGQRRRTSWAWLAVASLPGIIVLADLPMAPHRVAHADPPVLSILVTLFGFALCLHELMRRAADRLQPTLWRVALVVSIGFGLARAWSLRPDPHPPALAAARDAVACWPNNAIIITDGELDSVYRVAAWPRRLTILNLASLGVEPYRRYATSCSADRDWQSIASVSPAAAIRNALQSGTPAVVLAIAPDWIVRAGRLAVPLPWGYAAADSVDAAQLTAHARALQRAIDAHGARLRDGRHETTTLLGMLSRAANDLGIVAESANDPDLAARLYELALRIDPPQPMAAMNFAVLLAAEGRRDEADAVWSNVMPRLISARAPSDSRRLLSRYGMPRSAEVLRRWIDATGVLDPAEPVPNEAARRRFLEGQFAAARAEIEPTLGPKSPSADWILYAICVDTLRDATALARAETEMLHRKETWASVLALLADREILAGNLALASERLNQATRASPWNTRVMESRLRLAIHEGRTHEMERIADNLLAFEPGNPWGNLALGLIHFARDRHDLAEAAFLRVAGREPLPIALNNLSWILTQQGRHAEALPFARRAVEADPLGAPLWHTLGTVLTGLGRHTEAARAYEREAWLKSASGP